MKFKPRFLMGCTILAVLLPMFPPIIAAQETAAHKLSAMDEFQLQLPTDPQISPDGKRIAYVRRLAYLMTDKRSSNV